MMLAIVFVSDTVVYVMLFFVLGLWFLFLIWLCMFVPFNRWLFFFAFFFGIFLSSALRCWWCRLKLGLCVCFIALLHRELSQFVP